MPTNAAPPDQLLSRIHEVLQRQSPLRGLMDLTLTLSLEGIRIDDIIKALEQALAEVLDQEGKFQEEAAIGDVLDMIQGFYTPRSESSEEAVFIQRLRTKCQDPVRRPCGDDDDGQG